ncbi:MAG TPA: SAM-dependent methyltransferase, partial [Bacillales bacterium]|nr:SAM-dependent methyltransferase [Bacillales bacterium]
GHGKFDVVTCNPPYFTSRDENLMKKNRNVAAARHEIHASLGDIVAVSGKLLKQGGKAAFVYPSEKFLELAEQMRRHRVEPKRVLWVHPREGKPANRVLIEGKKDARPGAAIEPPLAVYNEENEYTKELRAFCDITSTL